MDLLAAVDVGTTNLKAGLFDADGEMRAFAEREAGLRRHPDGRVAVDADGWWQSFLSAFEECLGRVDRSAVRALGVSSQAQTYVFLDESGKALGPAVSWLDATGDAEGAARELGVEDFYEHTGWGEVSPLLALCKLRNERRSLAKRAPSTGLRAGKNAEDGNGGRQEVDSADMRLSEGRAPSRPPRSSSNSGHDGARPSDGARRRSTSAGSVRMVFPDGFLFARLCGERAVSRNLASMSGLYSLRLGDWRPEAAQAARLRPEELPRIAEMGEAVGRLGAHLARRFGLAEIPIVAGANDQTCAALGAGLSGPGQPMLALGTAMVVYQVIPADAPPAASRPHRGLYPGGLHYQLALLDTGGAALEWARDTFAPGMAWPDFFAEALSVRSEGVTVSPTFTSGATFSGLRLGHTRAHLLRAVLEGLTAAARRLMDDLGCEGPVLLTGGASKNDGWMQMIAEVSGRTLRRVEEPQASLRGAAILAGCGAGVFGDPLSAARGLQRPGREFVPTRPSQGA